MVIYVCPHCEYSDTAASPVMFHSAIEHVGEPIPSVQEMITKVQAPAATPRG